MAYVSFDGGGTRPPSKTAGCTFVVSVIVSAEGAIAGATKLALQEGISLVTAIQKHQHCAVISFVVIIVSVLSFTFL